MIVILFGKINKSVPILMTSFLAGEVVTYLIPSSFIMIVHYPIVVR